MHPIKKLAAAATATALIGAIGASMAQTESDTTADPMASSSQEVVVPANASGQQIYFFRDQGNSPESDPAAHLMLIKHEHMVPVAETTTTTTVAQSTTPQDTTTTAMPSASDTSNTDTSATATTDTSTASSDNTPALAPKADRN